MAVLHSFRVKLSVEWLRFGGGGSVFEEMAAVVILILIILIMVWLLPGVGPSEVPGGRSGVQFGLRVVVEVGGRVQVGVGVIEVETGWGGVESVLRRFGRQIGVGVHRLYPDFGTHVAGQFALDPQSLGLIQHITRQFWTNVVNIVLYF